VRLLLDTSRSERLSPIRQYYPGFSTPFGYTVRRTMYDFREMRQSDGCDEAEWINAIFIY
jgi:hypothetical protein